MREARDQGLDHCRGSHDNVSHVDAAALALIGLTALISVEDTLKLQKGETILIQGGAGGVAGFAIEVAKHIGARVITTASAANHDYLRKLGADEIIDYRAQDVAKVVSGVDCVFDTVGGDVTQKSFAVLRPAVARRSLHRARRRRCRRAAAMSSRCGRRSAATGPISTGSCILCRSAPCTCPR